MEKARFDTHLRRIRQVRELDEQLQRTDLTPEMIGIIMATTVEACVDAYVAQDFVAGDNFARLNGVAEQRARNTAA